MYSVLFSELKNKYDMRKLLEQLEFENKMLEYKLRMSEDREVIAKRLRLVLIELKMTYFALSDVRSRVLYFLLSLAIKKITNKI